MPSVVHRHCDRFEPGEICEQDVHGWFELSYSSYLVLPRALMQAMPADWQHNFVRLLEDMQATFRQENDNYTVLLRTPDGTFITDPFRRYRHPDMQAIEAARQRALHG